MIRTALILFLGLTLLSCAATYSPPQGRQAPVTRPLAATQDAIFAAAKTALTLDGYQIVSSDDGAGLISTAPRQLDLSEAEADCGSTLGLPYIRDQRTINHVAVNAVAEAGRLTLRLAIDGEYLKANVTQSIALTCVSTGAIEDALFRAIEARL